jgi:formiminotetrahydrofolate cyclodeaminase
VPGGGSAAALAGAIGAALIEMAANYSRTDLRKETANIRKIKNVLINLIDLDAMAYEKYSKRKTEKNLKKAADVPLDICKNCIDVLKITRKLTKKFNKNLLPDVKSGKILLKAGFSAALSNVFVNLKNLSDKNFVSQKRKIVKKWKKEICGL